eukprot:scaffold67478_cov59-Attheya_sp.AAC.1
MDHADEEWNDDNSYSKKDEEQRGHDYPDYQEQDHDLPSFLVRAAAQQQQQQQGGRPPVRTTASSGMVRRKNETASPSSHGVHPSSWQSLESSQNESAAEVVSTYRTNHDAPPPHDGPQGLIATTNRSNTTTQHDPPHTMATPLGRHDPSLSPIVSNQKRSSLIPREEEDDHDDSHYTGDCPDVTLSSLRLEEEDAEHHPHIHHYHPNPNNNYNNHNHNNDSTIQDSDPDDDEEEATWMYRRAMQPPPPPPPPSPPPRRNTNTNKHDHWTAKKSNRTVFEEQVMEADETTSLLGHNHNATNLASRGVWNRPWWKQKATTTTTTTTSLSLDEHEPTSKHYNNNRQPNNNNDNDGPRPQLPLKWSGGVFSSSASEVTSIYTTGDSGSGGGNNGNGNSNSSNNDKKHDAPNYHHHPTGHLFSSATSQSKLPFKSYSPASLKS